MSLCVLKHFKIACIFLAALCWRERLFNVDEFKALVRSSLNVSLKDFARFVLFPNCGAELATLRRVVVTLDELDVLRFFL